MINKKEIRSAIRAKKRAMTETEIAEKSAALAEKFFATDLYRNAKTIYGYLPYNQEVRTTPMLCRALSDGKKVAVPKVYGEEMRFLYVDRLESLDEAGGFLKSDFGIPEPIADVPVADDETALVLMPGLAFDKDGHRIGYGGGFYDKFLSAEPNHPTLALCYDFQMLPKLETQEFDIPMDLVIWA